MSTGVITDIIPEKFVPYTSMRGILTSGDGKYTCLVNMISTTRAIDFTPESNVYFYGSIVYFI